MPGIGLAAASRQFVKVLGITWAGSQLTKVLILQTRRHAHINASEQEVRPVAIDVGCTSFECSQPLEAMNTITCCKWSQA